MRAKDEDEPLTDVDVHIDASALAGGSVTRDDVLTIPVGPPAAADAEPNTAKPMLRTPALAAKPTPSSAPPEEEESTTLSLESRLLKAFQSAHEAPTMPEATRVSAVDLLLEAEPQLEETKPRPAVNPVLPKGERSFSMDLPPTAPAEFSPLTGVLVTTAERAPRERKSTVKIASNVEPAPIAGVAPPVALPPVAAALSRAQAAAPTVGKRPKKRHGRWIALALLVALVAAGIVNRDAVVAFAERAAASAR